MFLLSDICEDLTKDDFKFYMFMTYGKIIRTDTSPLSWIWDRVLALFFMIFLLIIITILVFLAIFSSDMSCNEID